jgi:hypothetical protein
MITRLEKLKNTIDAAAAANAAGTTPDFEVTVDGRTAKEVVDGYIAAQRAVKSDIGAEETDE